jgi:hypothetical protein
MREYSIDECLGLIGFVCVIVAIDNMYVLRSSVIWQCLAIFAGMIVFYWLIKIIRLIVHAVIARTGMHSRKKQQILELSDGEQYPKGRIINGSLSQQDLTSEHKNHGFKIPSLAGFAPQLLQASKRGKTDPQSDVEGQGFKLPSLAGFAPQQFLASKKKQSRQATSPLSGGTSQQQQISESEGAAFKLPSLAGFAPQQLRASKRKKPDPNSLKFQQEPSPSPNFVPPALPPDLFL